MNLATPRLEACDRAACGFCREKSYSPDAGGGKLARNRPGMELFVHQWTTLLTTFKRDGTPIPTPVNLAVEGDRAYFRTYRKAGKTKRLRNNPAIEIAPCSPRGRPEGPSVRGEARPPRRCGG